MNLYLAGPIRDGVREDIEWREELIGLLGEEFEDYNLTMLNPLAGKVYYPSTGEWTVGGIQTNERGVYRQDLWCVKRADIVVANLSFLDGEFYQGIGTLMELGAAAANGHQTLVYTFGSGMEHSHRNTVFKQHPFLAGLVTEAFHTFEECKQFLYLHLHSLLGVDPRFGGIVE